MVFKNILFKTPEDLKHYIENECDGEMDKLLAQKTGALKTGDPFVYSATMEEEKTPYAVEVDKDGNDIVHAGMLSFKDDDFADSQVPELLVRSVINTCGVYDSHGDVHISGLWKKSLQENKDLMLLQEHNMKFMYLISDEVVGKARTVSWKKLGYPQYKGSTQALVFDSDLSESENTFMVNKYRKGKVKNHSVGMRYVRGVLCVNSEDSYWEKEKENWDKYIDQVINPEAMGSRNMFYAVIEAKVIEGSAVLIGSNRITPTLYVREKEQLSELEVKQLRIKTLESFIEDNEAFLQEQEKTKEEIDDARKELEELKQDIGLDDAADDSTSDNSTADNDAADDSTSEDAQDKQTVDLSAIAKKLHL